MRDHFHGKAENCLMIKVLVKGVVFKGGKEITAPKSEGIKNKG